MKIERIISIFMGLCGIAVALWTISYLLYDIIEKGTLAILTLIVIIIFAIGLTWLEKTRKNTAPRNAVK